ncbi:MAG: hypothetical protein E2590_17735 [Chryseobacterium sp.]|nr:hypothetical protein [Chryseobacterium sp.]
MRKIDEQTSRFCGRFISILCFLSFFNIFGQSFSVDNPDIHIVSGTVVVFKAELKLPSENSASSRSKISIAKKRSHKERSLSDQLRSKSFKKKVDKPEDDKKFLAGGPGSSYAFGLYRSTNSVAVVAGSQYYKSICVASVSFLLLFMVYAIQMQLYLRYSSISLNKISAFLCRRPPPIRL